MKLQFIDPGRFRNEMTLHRLTPVADGAGGYAETWTVEAVLFAALEPVSAHSVRAAAQELEHVTHRITTRFRATIKAGMRLSCGARQFDIRTVHDPDESERYLVLMVREELP